MFDFTKEIKLPEPYQKKYRLAQVLVFIIFVAGLIYFSWLVFFPVKNFDFFFRTPQATRNTIINPRYVDGKLFFDAAVASIEGNFSKIKINLILEKGSNPIESGSEIKARKSYQAFFYPEGDPVTKRYNQGQNLPFPDGSLISSQTSVFITSGNLIYPIDEQATFESMGFFWQDVIPATSEEIGAYQKQKLFTIASPHPNGTIFSGRESGEYYLIQDGKKRNLSEPEIASSYLHKNPVIADEKSLTTSDQCNLKKDFDLINNSYSCSIPVESLEGFLGNDYQFETDLGEDIKIKEAHVVFEKKTDWENLRLALADIKKNIIVNFYGRPQ
jgi:hypothetical protein